MELTNLIAPELELEPSPATALELVPAPRYLAYLPTGQLLCGPCIKLNWVGEVAARYFRQHPYEDTFTLPDGREIPFVIAVYVVGEGAPEPELCKIIERKQPKRVLRLAAGQY